MAGGGQSMVDFLGVPADRRLLGEDMANLPAAEQYHETAVAARGHDRLVATGSTLTGVTLVGGAAMALYGGAELLFGGGGGGAAAAILLVVGLLLVATHWGWVHVAEYAGVTIDERQERESDRHRQAWLASVAPYPRFSVSTSVGDDASTRVARVLHKPVLTPAGTFTFERETDAEERYDAHTPAAVIAGGVETRRREARLETDRLRELWDAAATAYEATLLSAHDDQQRLLAERAAAAALSEHINASMREPPLVE
jgi:hypothetical protein